MITINDSFEFLKIEDEEDLAPQSMRIYEFLHSFQDVSLSEYYKEIENMKNDPLYNKLKEEIQRQIDSELLEKIEILALELGLTGRY